MLVKPTLFKMLNVLCTKPGVQLKKIKLVQEELKKVEDEVEESIDNVDTSVIENTPMGFKAFIIQNWGTDYKISDKFGWINR
jgi:hypothetical protein